MCFACISLLACSKDDDTNPIQNNGTTNNNPSNSKMKVTVGTAVFTATEIDESVTVFTPLHINYGKHTKIGKNVFINFDCVFLDLGGIIIEDNVQIAPKVSLLTESHPLNPKERQSLIPKSIHIKKNTHSMLS